jgi:hypothetical protein
MTTLTTEPILPRHPRWEEFLDRLCGPEGCAFAETRWTCYGDQRFSRRILAAMGLDEREIAISLAYYRDHGGHCDCEVLFNLDRQDEGED